MADLKGQELLRNFRQRKELGLLPGFQRLKSEKGAGTTGGTTAVLPAERCSELLAHSAFGYVAAAPPVPQTSAEESLEDGAGISSQLAELQARQSSLEAELQELEDVQRKGQEKAAGAEQRAIVLQQEMSSAVDEHSELSKALIEARSRVAELVREYERLQSILEDAKEEEEIGLREQKARAAGSRQLEKDCSASKAEELLALHRAHLLRLEAEKSELQKRLRTES
eukprot:TRINITY_DN38249_c0_g1_i1.p1 TRINITY_DN38249_c0_g1~~TRINITY_DN38249_c0_g1_i1.p1  ORF type:complete len:226 (-),score=54.41 TRINITY_DN38249_c0_g1_i1:117-794(-)